MFEHYTYGAQAKPLRREDREISPKDMAGANELVPQDRCPSPPIPATTVPPSTEKSHNSLSTTDTIDSLAQKLSRQNLQLDRATLAQLQSQLSSAEPSLGVPCMSPIPPCSELEIDAEPQFGPDSPLRHRLAAFSSKSSELMNVDQRPAVPDMKRLRRQHSSRFNNNPDNTRTIQTLVEGMIASGSQCNVHRGSPPPATPTSAKRLEPVLEPLLEPDPHMNVDLGCVPLEVDEQYVNGQVPDTDREEMLLLESMMSLRRAGTPAGIRKVGLLPYRASAEAALNCANVVRSRPRMRKRKSIHRGSMASSAVSSAFSSPVIPPSLPDEYQHIPDRRV